MVSFGKDSITMLDMLCVNKIPFDFAVFSDTLLEFPEMYEYANRLQQYFKTRYDVDFKIMKPMTTFEEWCFGVIRKPGSKQYGNIRGVPNPADADSQCFWRRESKVKPAEAYFKELGYEVAQMFAYTTDETRNVDGALFPLRNAFKINGVAYDPLTPKDREDERLGMSELDCKLYTIEREMENPLYKLFTRTGCAICPFQSERAWFQIWKHYPETWEYVKFIEKRLEYYESKGMKVANRFWFPDYKTTNNMEFKFKNKDVSLFNFSDEPVKDCLCKI